jgi:hypothetical protein
MRKAIFIAAVVILAMTLSSMTASASTSTVTLTAPTTGTITFTGNGGSPIMTITGPLNGVALNGTGAFASATSFTLSGGPLLFTAQGDPGDFATAGTLSFLLNSGTLFTGTLSNIELDQTGQMLVLTGTLNGQQVAMIIDLQFGTPIGELQGPHSTEIGSFSAGEAASVTPEPGTMLLFGSGLLLAGGVLRRKLIA